MEVGNLIWLGILFVSVVWPFLRRLQIEAARQALIQRLERRRGSKVITLIHRQEGVSLLGIPLIRYITIEDSERVLREVRSVPPDRPIDLVLHTPGGLVLAAEQIAMALARHPAPVTVFVPHYAMSGGTLLALAADAVHMDPGAVLGPVDPQLGDYPAASLLRVYREKPVQAIADETLVLVDLAEKAQAQVQAFVEGLLARHLAPDQARAVAQMLTAGRWTHDYPLTVDQLREFGLPVGTEVPAEVYQLMALYAQQGDRRPSLLYTPAPGQAPGRRRPGGPDRGGAPR